MGEAKLRGGWVLGALIAGVLIRAGLAMGGSTYELTMNEQVGDRTGFSHVHISVMKLVTRTDGRVTDSKNYTERFVQDGTEEVVAVKDVAPTAARFMFGEDCGTTTTQKGKGPTTEPAAYAGESVTLRRLPSGAVSDDVKGTMDADAQRDLDAMLEPDDEDYPDHAVAIGDSWDATERMKPYLNLGPNDTAKAFVRLEDVSEVGGRQVAKLAVSAAFIQQVEGFVTQETEIAGTELVDLESGRIVRCDYKGKVTLSGEETITRDDGSKVKTEISGKGTITDTQTNGAEGSPMTRPMGSGGESGDK